MVEPCLLEAVDTNSLSQAALLFDQSHPGDFASFRSRPS